MESNRLLKASMFCKVLARARSARVRGWWDGSAYCSHPCGLLVGNMRFANHWSAHDYCSIVLGTTDKWKAGCDNPAVHGDPFPHCIDGEEVTVWSNGRWHSETFREALESRVVAILNRALADTAAAESWENVLDLHAAQTAARRHEVTAQAALALAMSAQ